MKVEEKKTGEKGTGNHLLSTGATQKRNPMGGRGRLKQWLPSLPLIKEKIIPTIYDQAARICIALKPDGLSIKKYAHSLNHLVLLGSSQANFIVMLEAKVHYAILKPRSRTAEPVGSRGSPSPSDSVEGMSGQKRCRSSSSLKALAVL